MVVTDTDLVRAGSLEELKEKGCLVVGAAGLATAELLVQRKQWDQALEVAQAVAERRGPERIPALLVLGQSALQLRRNVQAV